MLIKEIKLSSSLLSFLFVLFGFMFMLPGYPVLCGAFFITLGIFQSFQSVRETNDIVFSALLPVSKREVVRGKMLFVCLIEAMGLITILISTVVRMTVLSELPVYRSNALMNANLFSVGLALIIFGVFNLIFIGGFFKTAYKIGKPFVTYIVFCFLIIGTGEALFRFPGLEKLNSFGFDNIMLQLILFFSGCVLYSVLTFSAYKLSCKRFEKIDL